MIRQSFYPGGNFRQRGGSRLTRLLASMPDPNNGSVAGGLASVLRAVGMAYGEKQDQAQYNAAQQALLEGMSAKPWQNPDAGPVEMRGPGGELMHQTTLSNPKPEVAGGIEGALTSLSQLKDNPYAGRLTQQLLSQKMLMDAEDARQPKFEAVQNPFGRGGIGQKNTRTGQIVNYQGPDVETFGSAPFEALGPDGKRGLFVRGSKGTMKPLDGIAPVPKDQTPETFGQPVEVTGPDGKPTLIQVGNRGSRLPLDGFSPKTKKEDGLSKFDPEQKLRKEYGAQTKDFVKVRDAYGRIVQSAKDPSPAGDLALIFNYMKVLDPGSVVRESEFATAENAAAWLQRSEEAGVTLPLPISSGIRRLASGQRLAPDQRVDFVERARGLYDQQLGFQKALADTYTSFAEGYGLDPKKVVYDLSQGFLPESPPTAQVNQTGQAGNGGAPQTTRVPSVSVDDNFDPLTVDVNTATEEQLRRIIDSLGGGGPSDQTTVDEQRKYYRTRR